MVSTGTHGSLFADDLLAGKVADLAAWREFDVAGLDAFERELRAIADRFPVGRQPNESQTEDDLIWPVLRLLGWTASLRQQTLEPRGRRHVPDGLLFPDEAAKRRANAVRAEWERYRFGAAVVESKRWRQPLDRGSGLPHRQSAPSSQILRYLRRVDDLTAGGVRWAVLTNGAQWRLYYAGARSVSEQFLEVDIGTALGMTADGELFVLPEEERRRELTLFALFFGRGAFAPGAADARTFHQRVLDEGRLYQERVTAGLSEVVFGEAFPRLARAVAAAAPEAPLAEVRDAALILLYRLLFILYAEDRGLLPVGDERYGNYAFRRRVREDVGRRKDRRDVFPAVTAAYWSAVDDLCRIIGGGDPAVGLPAYDGGLFDPARVPLLGRIRLGDDVLADVVDALSFERTAGERRYVNYRDLSVRQLGSIYERLLEHDLARAPDGRADGGGEIVVRLNVFARKDSGSYYTPDDLVGLIIDETIRPLVADRLAAFEARARELARGRRPTPNKLRALRRHDPAERILDLKVCDPAMGSGHFLVGLVDYLADRVITALADAEAALDGYVSPLAERIDAVRRTILNNAETFGWAIDPAQLDDRRIVRRMVLKRCVYGVDKNPLAVELAKVSLWLHTFTAGAPLSFLDHHLRCGDSLFGAWVRQAFDAAERHGGALFLNEPLNRATRAAGSMRTIEELTDAEIAEAERSAGFFADVDELTSPLASFLSLVHACDWLPRLDAGDERAWSAFLASAFGDPVAIAAGKAPAGGPPDRTAGIDRLLARMRDVAGEERFLHWQVAFPGIWSDWEAGERQGGFDAVIGNPPWDRMKLQQVEWFATRRPEVAHAARAADRKRMVDALRHAGDPLDAEFRRADERAGRAARIARTCGDYPLLANGDVNVYSLFVERAMALVKPEGVIGLLTPSGIASDKTAAPFFRGVATEGRLRALYDFENRRTRHDDPPFFPDVHASFKFCVLVAGRSPRPAPARCAFFLQGVSELADPDRCFSLTADDFARVNPNTGTAPVFRSRRDAEITTAIYGRLPVFVDRSGGGEAKAWPVTYERMFDMTNDSGRFRRADELEEREGAWRVAGNRFDSPAGAWLPLYEGKMVQAYDHRAASIVVNPANLHRPAQTAPATDEQRRNPDWLPNPRYWVEDTRIPAGLRWFVGWKDVTAPTNARTIIGAVVPRSGAGNTFPVLLPADDADPAAYAAVAPLVLANLNAVVLDYVARQKVQGQHLNLYIVEQLPVVPLERYDETQFGPKSAADIIRDAVLELTCTAHDMAPFARDVGHVDAAGAARPPFPWDAERRLRLRAKLDALFFHLYGVTDRDDVRYVYSTFPIVEHQETASYGRYRSRDLCLAYMNALAAGHPDAEPDP